jgi:hypothetical protein
VFSTRITLKDGTVIKDVQSVRTTKDGYSYTLKDGTKGKVSNEQVAKTETAEF